MLGLFTSKPAPGSQLIRGIRPRIYTHSPSKLGRATSTYTHNSDPKPRRRGIENLSVKINQTTTHNKLVAKFDSPFLTENPQSTADKSVTGFPSFTDAKNNTSRRKISLARDLVLGFSTTSIFQRVSNHQIQVRDRESNLVKRLEEQNQIYRSMIQKELIPLKNKYDALLSRYEEKQKLLEVVEHRLSMLELMNN